MFNFLLKLHDVSLEFFSSFSQLLQVDLYVLPFVLVLLLCLSLFVTIHLLVDKVLLLQNCNPVVEVRTLTSKGWDLELERGPTILNEIDMFANQLALFLDSTNLFFSFLWLVFRLHLRWVCHFSVFIAFNCFRDDPRWFCYRRQFNQKSRRLLQVFRY